MTEEIKIEEFIYSTKGRRGDGKDFPVRGITEVYTKSGELVATHDPYSLTVEEAIEFAKWNIAMYGTEKPDFEDYVKWINRGQ